jgi:hypothetical protein
MTKALREEAHDSVAVGQIVEDGQVDCKDAEKGLVGRKMSQSSEEVSDVHDAATYEQQSDDGAQPVPSTLREREYENAGYKTGTHQRWWTIREEKERQSPGKMSPPMRAAYSRASGPLTATWRWYRRS